MVGVQVTSQTLGGSCLHSLMHPLGKRDLDGEPKTQDHLRAVFFSLGTIHVWGWIILCCRDYLMPCRMLTRISGLSH